jgi:hypothetical protein
MENHINEVEKLTRNLDVEICLVDRIIAKRIDLRSTPEFLVSWVEYPGEDTWESIYNLKNVQHKI